MQKRKGDIEEGGGLGLKKVKTTYKDIDDYISTFEPLIFEEVKAQIAQKKDEEEGLVSLFSSFLSCFVFRKFFHHSILCCSLLLVIAFGKLG